MAGKHLMYEYCAKRGVNHWNVGKLLVAADEKQAGKLRHYMDNAAKNGVELKVHTAYPYNAHLLACPSIGIPRNSSM